MRRIIYQWAFNFLFAADIIWIEVETLIIKKEVSAEKRMVVNTIAILIGIGSIHIRVSEPYV